MKNASEHTITQSFVTTLFQHPTFMQKLQQCIKQQQFKEQQHASDTSQRQLSVLVDEISSMLCKGNIVDRDNQYQMFRKQVEKIYAEIDKIKDMTSFQNIKSQTLPRQFQYDSNSQDEHFFDLPSIKRTITSLQQKVKEISLNSSVVFDVTESKEREDAYNQRFNSAITEVEQNIYSKHQQLQQTVNKRIDKQQKTINNILETLNDMNGSPNTDKNSNLLSNSKSATKLKSFFGFKM